MAATPIVPTIPTVLWIFPALVCAVSWYGAGVLIGALVPGPTDRLLRELSRVGSGAAAFAIVTYGLGRLSLYRSWLLAGLTVVLAAVAVVQVWRARAWRIPCRPVEPAELFFAVVAAGMLIPVVAVSAAPPTGVDALRYHLTLPDQWLANGTIDDVFWSWESFNPFTAEMLFGQGLAFGGGETAAAINGLLMALAAAAVYALGRQLGSPTAAAGSVALFASLGLIAYTTLGNFVEIALAFFSVLAAALAVRYWNDRAPVDAAWAGVFAGAAAGTKYAGLLTGGVVVLGLLTTLVRRPRLAALVVILAVVVALPWYVKNAIVAGNPVYPFYFGGDAPAGEAGAGIVAAASKPKIESLRGVPDVSLYLLRIPGLVLLMLAALGFLLGGRTRLHLAISVGLALYTGLWLYYSPQGRYYLGAFGVIAALGGLALARLIARSRAGVAAAVFAVAIVVAGWFAGAGPYVGTWAPVAFGFEDRASFSNRISGVLYAYRTLNEISPGGPVAIAGTSNAYEYPERSILLEPRVLDPRLPAEEILRALREYGVRYVVAPGTAGLADRFGCLEELGTAPAELRWEPLEQGPRPLPLGIYWAEPCYASLAP